jgi:exonuclease 3'-5' domain-containing protein 1
LFLISHLHAVFYKKNCPSSACLAVDLEGVKLGVSGTICLIQLVISTHPKCVYQVDVCALGPLAFDLAFSLDDAEDAAFAGIPDEEFRDFSIRSILEDKAVEKLLWDCRNDQASLHNQWGVRLKGVVDLQLHDAAAKCHDGEYIKYLTGLGWIIENTDRAGLTHIERIEMVETKAKARELFAPDKGGSYEVWKVRPLSPVLRDYATDARVFFALQESYREAERVFKAEIKRGVETRLAAACKPTHGSDGTDPRLVDEGFKKALLAKRRKGGNAAKRSPTAKKTTTGGAGAAATARSVSEAGDLLGLLRLSDEASADAGKKKTAGNAGATGKGSSAAAVAPPSHYGDEEELAYWLAMYGYAYDYEGDYYEDDGDEWEQPW